MKKRILITGPSGVGKTTLAQELSKVFNIPFVEVNMFKMVCPCYSDKIKTHQDLIDFMKLNPEAGAKMQFELLISRQIKFGDHYSTGFVTDRGHIDSWVYTSLQVVPYLKEGEFKKKFIEKLVKKFKSVHRLFTHIIYLPLQDDWEIEDNNKRVPDTEFQKKVDFIYRDVLRPYLRTESIYLDDIMDIYPVVFEMGERDLDKRIEVCKSFFI